MGQENRPLVPEFSGKIVHSADSAVGNFNMNSEFLGKIVHSAV